MLEAIVALTLFVALIVAGARPRSRHPLPSERPFTTADGGTDLPCPWCMAPTGEDDPACPSCGQRFG